MAWKEQGVVDVTTSAVTPVQRGVAGLAVLLGEGRQLGSPQLHPNHAAKLAASAVLAAAQTARGYRSVTSKQELGRLGFAPAQRLTPALLIPLWDARGEAAGYLIRPDAPRVVNGSPLKYEMPKGARGVLDVAPLTRGLVSDPAVPLWVTEGPIKGDALASRGVPVVAVNGVWGWRGRNAQGGSSALADWESVPLKGRSVVIAFDSDVVEKPLVRQAAQRLSDFLSGRGASVRYALLPAAGAGKVGVDDYLAAHALDELAQLVVAELPECAPDGAEAEEGRCCVVDGKTYMATPDGLFVLDDDRRVQLATFDAEVCREVLLDDGEGVERRFEVEVRCQGRKGSVVVTPERLVTDIRAWAAQAVGAQAAVLARHPADAANVVQLTSQPTQVHTYAHVGWRQVDGAWCWLHSAGGLRAEGNDSSLSVDPGPELAPVALPDPPRSIEGPVQAVARLLSVGPDRVTAPLVGGVLRAVVGVSPPDWSLLIVGRTGVGKTELASLAQSFFGRGFGPRALPGTWSATENALEELAFRAKDCVLVIDEFAPSANSPSGYRGLQAKAERLLRAQGNASGRTRMRADGTLRATRAPRGLIVSTGESLPLGESLLARTLVVQLSAGDVRFGAELRAVQGARGELAAWLAAYVAWLAADLPARQARWRQLREGLSGGLSVRAVHLRSPQIALDLLASWALALEWLESAGASLPGWGRERLFAGVTDAVARQAETVKENAPGLRFMDVLGQLFAARKCYLDGVEGGEPPDPGAWGWEQDPLGGGWRRPERGQRVGWAARGGEVWLSMDLAMGEVAGVLGRSGAALAADATGVLRDLDGRGVLYRPDPEHLLALRRVQKRQVRVAILRWPDPVEDEAQEADGDTA